MTILNLPEIPASSMFIGDKDKVMTLEWQEFFRDLLKRVGGITAPTITELSSSGVSELYKTDKNYTKRVDELEQLVKTLIIPKSYDKRINDLELLMSELFSISGQSINLPSISTDNAAVRWDGTLGTKIQNSNVIIDDDGNITISGSPNIIITPGGTLSIKDTDGDVIAEFTSNGDVQLNYNNIKSFATHSSGIEVHDTSGNDAYVWFYDSGGTNIGYLGIRNFNFEFRTVGGALVGQIDMNSETSWYFNEVKRFQTTVTGADIIGDLTIGDLAGGSNYAKFETDGELKLYGTGRGEQILESMVISGRGASAPTQRTDEAPYLSFTFAIGNDVHQTFEAPYKMDYSADSWVKVHWYTDVSQETDVVNWQCVWNAKAETGGEAVNAGATTDTSGDQTCPVQWEIKETLVETIPGGSIAEGDIIGLEIERIAKVGGADPGNGTIHVLTIEFEYVCNRPAGKGL